MENTYLDVSNKDNRVKIQYNVNGTVNVYITQPSASNTAAPVVVLHSTEANIAPAASGANVTEQLTVSDASDQPVTHVERVVSAESERYAPARQADENQNQGCVSEAVNQLATRVSMNQSSAGNTAAPVVLHSTEVNRAGDSGASLDPGPVSCARCGAEVKVIRYFGDAALRCERCAHFRKACFNQYKGCLFIDIPKKCWKHERYYCQLRTQCNICDKAVSNGSLSAHYGSEHRHIMRRAGSTWRATRASGDMGCYYLVPSVAGFAVYWYRLLDTAFELHVYIPVVSGRLREYRCVITLTLPTTRYTRTYTPDVLYVEYWDWSIRVKKEEFPSWSRQFDVSIDIIKID